MEELLTKKTTEFPSIKVQVNTRESCLKTKQNKINPELTLFFLQLSPPVLSHPWINIILLIFQYVVLFKCIGFSLNACRVIFLLQFNFLTLLKS